MAARKMTPGVLASFEHIDVACDTIRALRAKGRKVHNVIQSRVRFKDGSIVEQQDSCDSRQWASMAIGGVGGFLAGRIPRLRAAKARRTLDTFIETHPQYKES